MLQCCQEGVEEEEDCVEGDGRGSGAVGHRVPGL